MKTENGKSIVLGHSRSKIFLSHWIKNGMDNNVGTVFHSTSSPQQSVRKNFVLVPPSSKSSWSNISNQVVTKRNLFFLPILLPRRNNIEGRNLVTTLKEWVARSRYTTQPKVQIFPPRFPQVYIFIFSKDKESSVVSILLLVHHSH